MEQDDRTTSPEALRPSWAIRFTAMMIGPLGILLCAELLFRLFPHWTDPPPPPPYDYRELGPPYGWYAQEGYAYTGEMKDAAGLSYPVSLHFEAHGFRRYGDLHSGRKRLMVIGDSYTACAQTSDEKTWYHLLGTQLDVEVFAYGNGGFGSTQEYLVVRDHIEAIQPDVLVWQLCANDFIDNNWELEAAARYHIYRPRPYTLEDGRIVTRRAARWPANLYPWSRCLYGCVQRLHAVLGIDPLPSPALSAESQIVNQGTAYAPFARSLAMTKAAARHMQAVLPPHTRLIAFSADGFQPQHACFEDIFRELDIPFVEGLPAYIHACEVGRCARADDGFHWNDYGNDRVAAFLLPPLRRLLTRESP